MSALRRFDRLTVPGKVEGQTPFGSEPPSTSRQRRETKCRVEDRVVTVRLRSLSLSKVEGSEVEPKGWLTNMLSSRLRHA